MTSIDSSLIVTILLWLASKIKGAFIWKNEMIGDNKSDVSSYIPTNERIKCGDYHSQCIVAIIIRVINKLYSFAVFSFHKNFVRLCYYVFK